MLTGHPALPGAIAALDAANALAVCTWAVRDGEAHLTACNAAFELLLGYTPGVLVAALGAGAPAWRSLSGTDTGAPAVSGEAGDDGHGMPVPTEYALRRRDGGTVVSLVTTVRGERAEALVSLCVDVTEQAGARRDAEQASQAKSRFLSVVSHELRTPLNAIQGQVELLREGVHGPVTDMQQNSLERVQRAGRRLREVIDEVLTLSRLEAGEVTYDVQPVSLARAIRAVESAVASRCLAKRQTMSVQLPAEDVTLLADEEKLHAALLALVANASKFTPPEGHITIDTASRAEVAELLFVRVTDTGVGVSRDHFESIFSPFAQADERSSRTAEGLGLGLTIARDLVRGMGGDIRVRSRPGAGATFTLAVRRLLP